jgi:hypothetical protein
MREDLDNWFGEGEWGFNVSMKVVNIHATLFRSTLTDTAVLAIAGTHSGTDTVLDRWTFGWRQLRCSYWDTVRAPAAHAACIAPLA